MNVHIKGHKCTWKLTFRHFGLEMAKTLREPLDVHESHMTFPQLYKNTDVQHRLLWSESFRWPRLPRFITLSLRPFVMSLKKRKQKCVHNARLQVEK